MSATSPAAKVGNEDLIAKFHEALTRFASVALDEVAMVRQQFQQRCEQVEDRARECEHEHDEVLFATDDSDAGSDLNVGEGSGESEARLEALLEAVSRVRDFRDAFDRTALCAEGVLGGNVQSHLAYLGAQVEELLSSASVQVPGAERSAAGDCPRGTTPASERLPAGCVWIQLTEIDAQAELIGTSFDDGRGRLSYQSYKALLDRLRDDVLPRLSQSGAGDGDLFTALDRASGADTSSGLRRVYDVFFGEDCIYLQRGRQAAKFSIVNGRHRIKVALDLGWPAVPARVKDLRNRPEGQ